MTGENAQVHTMTRCSASLEVRVVCGVVSRGARGPFSLVDTVATVNFNTLIFPVLFLFFSPAVD